MRVAGRPVSPSQGRESGKDCLQNPGVYFDCRVCGFVARPYSASISLRLTPVHIVSGVAAIYLASADAAQAKAFV